MRAGLEFFCAIWWSLSVEEKSTSAKTTETVGWQQWYVQVEVMQEVPGSCESENTCEGADEKCTMIPRWRFSHVTHIIPGDTFSLPDSYCVCSEVVEKVWDYQLQPVHRIRKYSLRRKKCEEQKPPCKTESKEDCRKRQSQVRYRPTSKTFKRRCEICLYHNSGLWSIF